MSNSRGCPASAPGTRAVRIFHNPAAARGEPYPPALSCLLSTVEADRAADVITRWPGYAPTPLRDLPGTAAELGLASIRYKDEGGRFGLGSFKALGGAYAVFRLLERHLRAPDSKVDRERLLRGGYRDRIAEVTVCTATAGNHGRSVAWGAQMFGCRCCVYVPAATAEPRIQAIASHGAEIVRVHGSYDDAVRRAAADAAMHGWWVVSDTSYPGYTEVPLIVMQGYTLLAEEIVQAWPDANPPTHVFLQCGVGGLAAAVCAHLWERWGGNGRPRCVVVEPEAAPCLQRTAMAGRPVRVDGPLDTTMSCLACGEASLLAWEVLERGADHFLTISDAESSAAVELLARGARGDPATPVAPSGAAGFAGLLIASRHPSLRAALQLNPASRALVIGSEGGLASGRGHRPSPRGEGEAHTARSAP